MCGRFSLFTPPADLASQFRAALGPGVDSGWRPRWNIGPSTDVLALTGTAAPGAAPEPRSGAAPEPGSRVIGRYRWGLVPPWAKDPSSGARTFNARGETVSTKPSFRRAFKSQRAAVLANGFFEWRKGPGTATQPFYFHRADGRPMALAGLWEEWHDRSGADGAPPLRSCTIITTAAGPDMAGIHDRMPVVLAPADVDRWIEPQGADPEELQALLVTCPAGTLVHHAVDRRVGSVRNDDPAVIEPEDPQ